MYAIESQGCIAVRARREDSSWVTIAVEDDGLGIPEDALPSIFEAFVTSRLDSRGTGLGLTVAEGIVHQHGGTLIASNRSEGGARLEVRLPAAASGGGPLEAGVAPRGFHSATLGRNRGAPASVPPRGQG
jgi:signal transduction histidine kinase